MIAENVIKAVLNTIKKFEKKNGAFCIDEDCDVLQRHNYEHLTKISHNDQRYASLHD